MKTRSNKRAFGALIAATLAASISLGCDQGNGPITTDDMIVGADDIGSDTVPCLSGLRKADGTCPPTEDTVLGDDTTTDSVATETGEDANPNLCAQYTKYEGRTWTCTLSMKYDCVSSFWINTDKYGIEYCAIGCPDLFYGMDANKFEWGDDSFVVPGDPAPFPCVLKVE